MMPALLDQARDRVGIGDGAIHNPTRAPVLATRNVVVVDAPRRRDSAHLGFRMSGVSSACCASQSRPYSACCPPCSTSSARVRARPRVCHISTRLLTYTLCFVT
jgi:hypothetical protein